MNLQVKILLYHKKSLDAENKENDILLDMFLQNGLLM